MIQAVSLCKKFGAIQAVNDFSLQVEPGEIVALLGPNGAGKTTCMRLFSGFLRPDSGRAFIAGFDSSEQALRAKYNLGYLAEHAPIYKSHKVFFYFNFFSQTRGLK